MKTTLEHLPKEKQDEILKIVEIVKEIVNPEMVILFGSYATGRFVDNRYKAKDGITYEYISDFDFLVVTKDNDEKTYVQESKILDRVHHHRPSVNLEIHEIDYINEGLEWGQYFFSDIVREGVLLYSTNNVKFIEPKTLTAAEAKGISERYFGRWLKRGTGFMSGVRAYIEEKEFNIAAFILHQAAESFYYTALLVFTGYKPKTHNLGKLKKSTKNISEELFLIFPENTKEEIHLFDLLKRGYVDARYKDDYEITLPELNALVARLEKMKYLVTSVCRSRIDSILG